MLNKILERNEQQLLLMSFAIVYLNMGWIKVCDADSLSSGDLIGFDYNNIKKILIAKIQDKIYATDGICTHEYADLSTGFLNEQEKTVTCPLHLSVFKLDNGVPQNPPAEYL